MRQKMSDAVKFLLHFPFLVSTNVTFKMFSRASMDVLFRKLEFVSGVTEHSFYCSIGRWQREQ